MANQNRYKKEIELLLAKGKHRTAEDIYKQLKKNYMFLGIGSVYRNLTELVEQEVLMKTTGVTDKVLYELYKKPHGHLVCTWSGRIDDIDISKVKFDGVALPDNFNLQNILITFSGHFNENAEVPCAGIAQVMSQMQK